MKENSKKTTSTEEITLDASALPATEDAESESALSDDTPRYASLRVRLYTTFIDCLLVALILQIFFPVFGDGAQGVTSKLIELQEAVRAGKMTADEYWQAYATLMKSNTNIHVMIMQLIMLALLIFPFWQYKGATPGKMLFKVKIVDAETFQAPRLRQWWIRFFGYFISTLPLGLGFLWAGIDKRKQTWHDKLAHTVVIHTRTFSKDWKQKQLKRQTVLAVVLLILLLVYSQVRRQMGL